MVKLNRRRLVNLSGVCSNLYEVIIISAGPGSYKCSSPAARGFDGKWEKAKIPSNIESRYFVLSFYLVAPPGIEPGSKV